MDQVRIHEWHVVAQTHPQMRQQRKNETRSEECQLHCNTQLGVLSGATKYPATLELADSCPQLAAPLEFVDQRFGPLLVPAQKHRDPVVLAIQDEHERRKNHANYPPELFQSRDLQPGVA